MHSAAGAKATVMKDRNNNFKADSKLTPKGRKVVDTRVSVCTDCRAGIFEHHEYLWTSRGLVHRGCDEIKNAS